jgi:putative membrane protein
VLFFCMESLWWTKPAVYRRFRSTEAEALVTRSLAFNQGFYNLFLAVGAWVASYWWPRTRRSRDDPRRVELRLHARRGGGAGRFLAQMLRGAAVQGLPPLVFLAVAAYVRWS